MKAMVFLFFSFVLFWIWLKQTISYVLIFQCLVTSTVCAYEKIFHLRLYYPHHNASSSRILGISEIVILKPWNIRSEPARKWKEFGHMDFMSISSSRLWLFRDASARNQRNPVSESGTSEFCLQDSAKCYGTGGFQTGLLDPGQHYWFRTRWRWNQWRKRLSFIQNS